MKCWFAPFSLNFLKTWLTAFHTNTFRSPCRILGALGNVCFSSLRCLGGEGYSRPSLQRRELRRRSGRSLGQRCLCRAQAMTQTPRPLVCSLDLIKCGSFPSCFLLHSCTWPWAPHQALGTRLAPQLLSHLCTLLPPRNLLSVPLLPLCPCAALCLPHPVPGSPCLTPTFFPTLSHCLSQSGRVL